MIRVLRGDPTPEELAAALAVVRARAAAASAATGTGEGAGGPTPWSDPARTVPGRLPAPGPDTWRTSFWPA
ncbi:acyl-CoA carboxylase epsilon subunit [Streptomyces sp. ST2-7A]|uniref:acyl-CoA carboxylase epsilon subunit n=1 Tax=Streptomyces sp. ST2-7A TaxID=2907214 RepID=UPI001F1D2DD6|nr:acyl-CoA carboxylase epsilon subunit [Streptomyces sp. ST2-7A]MCE7082974.1 acyl-CoA carboxylase subunit epsilon [Streptomyces sp. ST2-7A]